MKSIIPAACLLLLPFAAQSQSHFFAGQPACNDLHTRIAYSLCYDTTRRVPNWVAYRIEPEFRDTPKRKGKYKSFRTDPDVSNPVKDSNYDGLFTARGYARGHLAPYAVMGGDRDNEALTGHDFFADLADDVESAVEDVDTFDAWAE